MSDLIWLSQAQMRRIEPHFPRSHGVPRVDDRRVVSGIIFVIRNGLRWRDAPKEYGPHKTIQPLHPLEPPRRIQPDLRQIGGERRQARSTDDRRHPSEGASNGRRLLKKGLFPDVSGEPRAA